ncbi:MAG: permease-like cell division protein FtsX [Candidatus Peribacteraceae bacterium]|jgi:cell division protein FtsX
MWGSAFGVLLGLLLAIQLLLLTALGAHAVAGVVRAETDVHVEVNVRAKDSDIQSLYAALKRLPQAENVSYATREQLLERERLLHPDFTTFIDQFGLDNPFRDTFSVTLRSLDDFPALQTFLRGAEWSSVVDPSSLPGASAQESRIRESLRLIEAGETGAFLLLSLLVVILLGMTVELVSRREQARRKEVKVERSMGARDLAILIPFATEASLLIIAAVLLSGFVALALLTLFPLVAPSFLSGAVADLWSDLSSSFLRAAPFLFIIEILLAPILAFLGTWLGLRKALAETIV